ncbi:MAG: EamA family transporter [Tannerellaceae bacterium]|nr:EamA family transporter [Tannerellaceae bacterium]
MKPMEGTSIRKTGILFAYFLIYVVWGSTYYFIGVALQGFPPFLLGALRFTTAGLILLTICCYRKEHIFKKSLIKKSAISGIVLLFIDMAVVMLAQQYLSSSLVAIIASSTTLWIMTLDVPMWKKNFRNPATVIGVIAGFLGVMLLYIEQIRSANQTQPHTEYGVLLLIFGCISWSLGTLYAKYCSSHEEDTNNFAGSGWQMLSAGTMFWIVTLFITRDIPGMHWQDIPVASWFSVGYLILLGSIMAYSAYVWLLKVRPATEVATHAYVNPFIAVLIGTTLGKEHVTWIQITGLMIILCSVMLINKKKAVEQKKE